MNSLDIIIACILGYCLIRGIFRGLIKELSSIVGVLAGVYLASAYYPLTSNLLSKWVANASYRDISGFLMIFCGVLLVVGVVGVIIRYLLKIASAGWVDRLLGTLFAVVKAVLIVSVILVILTSFLPKNAAIMKNSILAPHVVYVSEKIIQMVPESMKAEFYNKFKELKNTWKGM
ncbi:MAG: CvpA family protein [Proteobacteria bacterium]|nr:CvpA family protein [Pseudomonadota bacterium]MBU4469844.1 CvpA family protein [Pseudomonadota bacterium]MCG2753079.1 CvpA family protein [Desulfobacteraceae bacterium]